MIVINHYLIHLPRLEIWPRWPPWFSALRRRGPRAHRRWPGLRRSCDVRGLKDRFKGRFTGKTHHLLGKLGKSMVSYRFSLRPIHWSTLKDHQFTKASPNMVLYMMTAVYPPAIKHGLLENHPLCSMIFPAMNLHKTYPKRGMPNSTGFSSSFPSKMP